MTTMKYKELNAELTSIDAHIAELKKLLLELSSQREEAKAKIQRHKQAAIDNYINLVNSLLDTQQELLEMGIDPTTIDMCEAASDVEETTEIEGGKSVERTMDGEHVEAEPSETSIEIKETEVSEEMVVEEKKYSSGVIDNASLPLSKKSKPTSLKPYFYVWRLRKGEYKKNCSVLEWKQIAPRLQTSMLKLTKSPVNRTMNMGNTMYRSTYATPDEGRIYSAYGTAPTLTATHSDITVRIGADPRSTEPTLTAA